MNKQQLAILKAEIETGAHGKGYQEIAKSLNALKAIPNPNTEPSVVSDVPSNLVEILTLMPRAERVAILKNDSFQDLAIAIWENDNSKVHAHLDAVVAWIAATESVVFETVSVQSLANTLLSLGQLEILGALLVVLAEYPGLSKETIAKLRARLEQTKEIPAAPTIAAPSRASELGLPRVRASDVQSAYHTT